MKIGGICAISMAVLIAIANVSVARAKTDSLPMGRCVNMGNGFEAPAEGEWGGKAIDAADFRRIAAAGFQTIRLPVRWAAHTGEAPSFTIDTGFMARVTSAVAQARTAGLNVIINSHHFDDLHANPNAHNIAKLAAIWGQVGSNFANQPTAHVWFEIENEPHDKFNDANLLDVINPALAALRKTNPDRAVIIGGEMWSGVISLKTLQLPDDPNVIPTFHYYDPFDFTHQGAPWAVPPQPLGRKFGTPDDLKNLGAHVAIVRAYIARTGKTPFMGEFGAYEKIPAGERAAYYKTVRVAFDALGIGTCAWAYTNTFPLWDQGRKAWVPGMRDAMGVAPAKRAPAKRALR